MYLFFLSFLIMISIVLIFLILLHPGKGINNAVHLNSSGTVKLFNIIGNNNFITNTISLFVCFFLIISIVLCNINDKKIHVDYFGENDKNYLLDNTKKSLNKEESRISNKKF
ncbi:preprotein translocase subunit SecG [Buchnera aphidicola (Melanaphis sacchari)]|uniref:Protein-export membrane protein SecG n=1 Tax=Buchnera aphidicola (Melanaphis sacchari) TaxID=2173854 RepID=A0A2U8DF04_9GAMM|nr:preprotein translocase subunit SecG [Buchnera aphidicola]AWH90416.1 preprotein translocase subunit SecG [Buchnera aphidicola (Melanaphis sacchari)]